MQCAGFQTFVTNDVHTASVPKEDRYRWRDDRVLDTGLGNCSIGDSALDQISKCSVQAGMRAWK